MMANTKDCFLQFMDQNTPMDIQLKELNINSNYYEIESLYDEHNVDTDYQYVALHINIHSLPDKLSQLKTILSRLNDIKIKVHFILLCETFLNDYNISKCEITGYKLVPQSRKLHTKGGVALYILTEFDYEERPEISPYCEGEFESVFVEILDDNKKIIVGEIYRIPNTNESISVDRFRQTLENIYDMKPDYCIIGTDQNFDYMKINSHSNTLNLFNNFLSTEMLPTITKPTRIAKKSATLIDNIYIKCDSKNVFSAILLSDISDHLPVLTCTGTRARKQKKPLFINHRPLNQVNIGHIKTALADTDWSYLQALSANDAYNSFVETLNRFVDEYAPIKTIRISPKHVIREPWMTPGILKSCTMRDKLYSKCLGQSKDDIRHIKFVTYRNMLNKIKRSAKEQYYHELLNRHRYDMKKTWGIMNSLTGRDSNKCSISDKFKINNNMVSDKVVIANKFCDYFTNVGKNFADAIPKSNKSFKSYLGQKSIKKVHLSKSNRHC